MPDRLAPSLRYLSLKNNKIIFCSLPRNHKFDHLDLTGNPFSMRPSHVVTLPNIKFVPKLQELASRNYLKLGLLYSKKIMAQYLCDYLDKAIYCPCSNVSQYFVAYFMIMLHNLCSRFGVEILSSWLSTTSESTQNHLLPRVVQISLCLNLNFAAQPFALRGSKLS